MKKLLLSIFALGGMVANAQLTCATALPVTAGSTTTCPQITGTYLGNCTGGTAATTPNAIWYVYTATANGELTITSDLPQNDGVTNSDDTRVSVITGTCTTLACYSGNDDVDDVNYLSTLTIPVTAGTTYYIVWDDRWSDLQFDFDVTFEAVSCIRLNTTNVNAATDVTVESATLSWAASLSSPNAYDVEYGATGFTQGAGTTAVANGTSINLTGITPVSGDLDYYVRANCGATQSAWVGPFALYLAATCPYTNNFDDTADYTDGFTSSTWGLGNTTGAAQSGTIYYFVNSSTTAATNATLYSRAISLQANEQVTMTFYTRLGAAAGSAQTLKVYVNNTKSLTGATQLGGNITVSGTTYALQTVTYTATAAGTYYFAFNNATPIITTATSLRLDTVSITSVLANNDFVDASFTVSPNPAVDVIAVQSAANTSFNAVEVYDLNGRIVKNIAYTSATDATINVADLAPGMYTVKVVSENGTAVRKVIKQ
ncbi:MAG: hypothetical protein RLZZ500_1743 [Bacteroidota bacterium]|jgi:hypothetical protein